VSAPSTFRTVNKFRGGYHPSRFIVGKYAGLGEGSVEARSNVLTFANLRGKMKTSDVDITTVLINDEIAMATVPGEAFIEHQLTLAKESPAKHTLFLGLAYCGWGSPFVIYIPTIQAAKEGGYGATRGTFLEVGAGERIVKEAVSSINKLLGDNP